MDYIITGDKNIFHFQWQIDEITDGDCYGYFCFCCKGKYIGACEELCTLSICVRNLKDFLLKKKERKYPFSIKMSKEELFHEIYDKYFDGSSLNDNSYMKMGETREIFWLDEVGEYSFRDKIGIILIDEIELNRQRIIWKTFKSEIIIEDFLPQNFFDNVSTTFLKEYDKLTGLRFNG